MISVQHAEQLILAATRPLGCEWVDLSQAQGRILAESIHSPRDFPPYPTSSMDGYAVRGADLGVLPVALRVIETLPAGTFPQRPLQPNQATRLFTGSVLPTGADTVIPQEDAERLDTDTVRILALGKPGQFVRQQGHFGRVGERVIEPGIWLGGPEIAVLAAVRRALVRVHRRPRVALLSTGDELVRIDQDPQPGQIVDSNQPGLAALVAGAGGIPTRWGILADDPKILGTTMTEALQDADLVLSTGGVSVGDYDYVEALLAELGGDIRIRSVAIKPGKPLTFAVFAGDKLFFGLPGNPVSALVTFWRFVAPAMAKAQGSQDLGPLFLEASTETDLRPDGKRETYLWGRARAVAGQLRFAPVADHNSGNLIALAGCNGLAVLPIGSDPIAAGERVQVMIPAGLP